MDYDYEQKKGFRVILGVHPTQTLNRSEVVVLCWQEEGRLSCGGRSDKSHPHG